MNKSGLVLKTTGSRYSIRDESGNVSPWSTVGQFSVGLLNKEDWKAEIPGMETFFAQFGDTLPEDFHKQIANLKARLDK